MKMRIASTVLLCLLFAAFGYASPRQQDEPKQKENSPAMQHPDAGKPDAKPESQEQKPAEMKPEKNNQEKPDKEAKDQEKEDKDREKQEKKEDKNLEKNDKNKDKQMGNMRDENRAGGRPAGKGGHIPDDKFRASFGRSHTFHPNRPTIVNNQPTFVYSGYTFVMVDPWPSEWAYTDDCYVDYVDGEYFLFDLLHPGVRIALFVSM